MAKPTWSIISPISGTGNQTISTSATIHTGRLVRSGTITVQTTTGTPTQTKTIALTQQALAEFVSVSSTTASADSTTTAVIITGTSNSSTLSFAVSGIITSVSGFKVNGTTATAGTAISGDPGATATYSFECTLNFTANSTIATRTGTVTISAATVGVTTAVVTLTQVAGAAELSTNVSNMTLVQAGTAQSFTITSNASWSVD